MTQFEFLFLGVAALAIVNALANSLENRNLKKQVQLLSKVKKKKTTKKKTTKKK